MKQFVLTIISDAAGAPQNATMNERLSRVAVVTAATATAAALGATMNGRLSRGRAKEDTCL